MKDGFSHLINVRTGGPRCDVTPLFGDGKAFIRLVDKMRTSTAKIPFDRVAGIDALGFILGAAFALDCGKGFVPIRKKGKLPVRVKRCSFKDYTGKEKGLEAAPSAFRRGERVLLMDDWIETGAQVRAACRLVEDGGAQVAAVVCLHADHNRRTSRLFREYKIISMTGQGLG